MTHAQPSLVDPERRRQTVAALRDICPEPGAVIWEDEALGVWESDAFTLARARPLAVVLPRTTEQVARIVAWSRATGIPVVPRGAGTSLSGGALPRTNGIVLAMARFNKILDIDIANRCAVVQPGVTNLSVSKAVDAQGFYYAPDPSSQIACTVGGNVAENAGGIHCLKYGVTSNNILGLEMVLADGDILRIGGKYTDRDGYDLLGLITGSEGLLGVVTEITVRLLPKAEAVRAIMAGFSTSRQAGDAVARIIGHGIIPAALEMMDRLAIQAAEAFCHAGYPLDVEALLIIELDGPATEVEAELALVTEQLKAAGASSIRLSATEDERKLIWLGRRSAFPAVGRLSPDYLCVDGTIPRSALPHVLVRSAELAEHHGLRVANVFHAGDGNLHPLILFDSGKPGDNERAEALGADILRLCVDVGGVLTGEHGVGVEKMDLMTHQMTENDLSHHHAIKCAFDPDGQLNPGKVFPTLFRCADQGWMRAEGGLTAFPDLPRF